MHYRPKGARRSFGEWDFVRVYGLDFTDRLKEAKFEGSNC